MGTVLPKTGKPRKLSKKQKGFIKDYIETGNATEAAMRNYNVKDRLIARVVGSENLAKPYIANIIEETLGDDLLAEKHLALLNKRDVLGEIDTIAVKAGLDMAYKIKGTYAPEKKAIITFVLPDEEKFRIDNILNDNAPN